MTASGAAVLAWEPTTGDRLPDYVKNGEKVAAAIAFMLNVYAPTPVQEQFIGRLDAFRAGCRGRIGKPYATFPVRGLSAVSQAGKSRLIAELQRRANESDPPNPRRVLHIQLTERITAKAVVRRILVLIGDPEAMGRFEMDVLKLRLRELIGPSGCELIAIDEVQLLSKQTREATQIASDLKSLADEGIVPILFAGDENAKGIFTATVNLRGRMGDTMELEPAHPKSAEDREALRQFAEDLDDRIAASGLVGRSNLRAQTARIGRAATGHVGRFSRIVGEALEHACARNAGRIEACDLSHAVDALAIPAKWTSKNPFPRRDDR